MTFVIENTKPKATTNTVGLLCGGGDEVHVLMDCECVATFYSDGEFVFHGQGLNKYKGKWNE